MQLGLVTYDIVPDLDLSSLLELCQQTQFDGIELRTTHAHGVEPELSAGERAAVRGQIAEAGITLWGLGTVCEYDSPDEDELKTNIRRTAEFIDLARDLGAKGVKVRPNRLHEDQGIKPADTLKQIGLALRECGTAAAEADIEIWLEVHGQGTSLPKYIETIMKRCDHPSVGVCWNSNQTDVSNGSIDENFKRLQPWIRSVHISELWRVEYPWARLFELLSKMGYDGYTLAEIPPSSDRQRVLHYYRSLWLALTGQSC